MKQQSLAIFFCFLVSASYSMRLLEQFPPNYTEKRSILSVLTEVQNQMAAGGPMDAVLTLLNDLKYQIQKEQNKHDLVNIKQTKECRDEISFRNKEISNARRALTEGQIQKKNCLSAKRKAQTELKNNLVEQKQARASLELAINVRRAQSTVYVSRVKDHEFAIHAIDEALGMLDDIFSGSASFAQLAKVSASMMNSAIQLKATSEYAPVCAVFAQIASKKVVGDPAVLEKIRGLLRRLRNNINTSAKRYARQEKKSQNYFNGRKSFLVSTLSQLKKQENSLRLHISAMSQCAAKQSGIIQSASNKLRSNTILLNDASKMCADFKASFDAISGKRKAEIRLIEQIRKIVINRYREISEYVSERGMKSVAQWNAYKNKTLFKKAAFKSASIKVRASRRHINRPVSAKKQAKRARRAAKRAVRKARKAGKRAARRGGKRAARRVAKKTARAAKKAATKKVVSKANKKIKRSIARRIARARLVSRKVAQLKKIQKKAIRKHARAIKRGTVRKVKQSKGITRKAYVSKRAAKRAQRKAKKAVARVVRKRQAKAARKAAKIVGKKPFSAKARRAARKFGKKVRAAKRSIRRVIRKHK